MHQPDLPGHPSKPGTGAGLAIGKSAAKPLTKAQLAFNRLVKRIEVLRRQVAVETEDWEAGMRFYAAELHPLEAGLFAARKVFARALARLLAQPNLLKRHQRKAVLELAGVQLSHLVDREGEALEDDLQELFRLVEGTSIKEALAEDREAERRLFEADFAAMGVDIDLSKLRPGMDPDALKAALDEAKAKIFAADEGPGPGARRVSPARAAREREKEELRQKDIGQLYKRLAKLLHPDLESDPALRAQKESAMKDLTTAYKANDLHALLRIELEWIRNAGMEAARLTDERLKLYNDVLREQVEQLEAELQTLPLHPRYHPLRRYVDPYVGVRGMDRKGAKRDLVQNARHLKESAAALSGADALGEIEAFMRAR
jgi:hypothetical protein